MHAVDQLKKNDNVIVTKCSLKPNSYPYLFLIFIFLEEWGESRNIYLIDENFKLD